MDKRYGAPPIKVAEFPDVDLQEVMYYLYLPVKFPGIRGRRYPDNIQQVIPLVDTAIRWAAARGRDVTKDYAYVSARKGWATPDNPLNRPGWHADGFGTDDINFVWWIGAGTRFAVGDFGSVPESHTDSLHHFEQQADRAMTYERIGLRGDVKIITNYPAKTLYAIDPFVVHATPLIEKGEWRQYVKVSLSTHRYNLENNSHNYLFDYDWPLFGREEVRNDTHTAQQDYA